MTPVVLGYGMLGSEIVRQTGWDYLSRHKDNIDICSPSSYVDKIKKYDVVINCVAHTNTYADVPYLHWDVNYKAVVDLVEVCNHFAKKLVHISTDYVYANSVSSAKETDVPVHANNWYSYTKLLADAYIQLKSNNYLIVRESHKPYPFPYFTAWKQRTNGDYVHVIAQKIIKLIETGAYEIFNVGTEEKTWYSLTKQEFKTSEIEVPGYAPKDITMNIDKMKNWFDNFQ